jgi:hypothetical protein
MTFSQKLFVGFILGGVLTLLLHPVSRQIMLYSFRKSGIERAVRANPLATEPLELFPPTDANQMSREELFLTAYRIARRLNNPAIVPAKADLAVSIRFAQAASAKEPDNAYWPQYGAAVARIARDDGASATFWQDATNKIGWDAGERQLLANAWNDFAAAERGKLAWQGILALSYAGHDPVKLITDQFMNLKGQSVLDRYRTLVNAREILDGTRSFDAGNRAANMANLAVFGTRTPLDSMERRQMQEVRSAFPGKVGALTNSEASRVARQSLQAVESWNAYTQESEAYAGSARARLRVETLLTAALPSALLFASLVMGVVACLGTILVTTLQGVINPDRRLIYIVCIIGAALVVWQTSLYMLGGWVLALGVVLSVPVEVAKDTGAEWNPLDKLAIRLAAILALGFFVAWLVFRSSPARMFFQGGIEPKAYFLIACIVVSFIIPVAALSARIKERPLLATIGESVRRVGLTGALLGLGLVVISAPLAIYRDAQNSAFVERWIQNETVAFRVQQS